MMILVNRTIRYSCFLFVPLLFQCSEDDPIPLIADAGQNQTVSPQKLVTLDGSKSEGPAGFTFLWTYSGNIPEGELNFQGSTTANPTFIPPKGANYYFTVTTSSGDQTSRDEVTVVATGGIELSGTLSEDMILVNIEPDASLPDYFVTADLVVPDGITLSIGEENVVVFFETGTGLQITQGGALTNLDDSAEEGFDVEFTGDDSGWKGILINNGQIELENAIIENAGKTAFDGVDEPGALILTGGSPVLESLANNTFKNSFSYDVYVAGTVAGDGRFFNNQMSYKYPVKAPITFMELWWSDFPNIDPEDVEYSIMVPGGSDQKDVTSKSIIFPSNGNFLIDGDFWAGSRIIVGSGCDVFIKEGSGILAEEGFSTQGTENSNTRVSGLNGANWKGIASVIKGTLSIRYTTIENAGYGIIDMGDFEAEAPASLYSETYGGEVTSNIIMNGGGFGYYNADTTRENIIRILENQFKNLANAAIRTNIASVGRAFFSLDPVNEFDLAPGIPAVLVQGDGEPSGEWPGLGLDNYYLIDANIKHKGYNDSFTLNAGARLKFRTGFAYVYDPPANSNGAPVRFKGTAENPVILESETGLPGSWGGVLFRAPGNGYWQINHCTIIDGGGYLLPGATEKANMISDYSGFNETLIQFSNNTISHSAGYGIVVEDRSYDFEYDNPGKNNTFIDNALGDVIVK